jgi:hypothetical protein
MWASQTTRSTAVPQLNMANLSVTLPVPKFPPAVDTAGGGGGGGAKREKEKHEEPVTVGVRIRPLTAKGATPLSRAGMTQSRRCGPYTFTHIY